MQCASVRLISASLLGFSLWWSGGCQTASPLPSFAAPVTREPLNLSTAKAAVVAYHDSGDYAHDVGVAMQGFEDWLQQRVARRSPTERLAVVFDIDDTVLSNYLHMLAQDFGYVPAVWDAWVAQGVAPAISAVKAGYNTAVGVGVEVIFLTGRRDPGDRAGTVANLRREGMGHYAHLILSAAGDRRSAEARKTEARAALAALGYTIIASVGDQESDLAGGYVERLFKLPNPFYFIP